MSHTLDQIMQALADAVNDLRLADDDFAPDYAPSVIADVTTDDGIDIWLLVDSDGQRYAWSPFDDDGVAVSAS